MLPIARVLNNTVPSVSQPFFFFQQLNVKQNVLAVAFQLFRYPTNNCTQTNLWISISQVWNSTLNDFLVQIWFVVTLWMMSRSRHGKKKGCCYRYQRNMQHTYTIRPCSVQSLHFTCAYRITATNFLRRS